MSPKGRNRKFFEKVIGCILHAIPAFKTQPIIMKKNNRLFVLAYGSMPTNYPRKPNESYEVFFKRAIEDGTLTYEKMLRWRNFGPKRVAKVLDALGLETQVQFILKKSIADRSIESLGLSVRATNILLFAGLDTVGKVFKRGKFGLTHESARQSARTLLGQKSLKEIENRLLAPDIGLTLK